MDDEQKAIESLRLVLQTYFPQQVEVVGSACMIDEAHQGIVKIAPDLVFLDVEMGLENGFQLLEKFKEVNFHVAFVTAHEEFALRAIKFSALDYILKPAGVEELAQLLDKVARLPGNHENDPRVKQMFGNFHTADKGEHRISIIDKESVEFLRVADLLYLTARGSYSRFHLRDGETTTSSKNLKHYETLLESYGFFRIHNSTLVNMRYIRRYKKSSQGTVIMEDGHEFPLAKGRKEEFMKLLALR